MVLIHQEYWDGEECLQPCANTHSCLREKGFESQVLPMVGQAGNHFPKGLYCLLEIRLDDENELPA